MGLKLVMRIMTFERPNRRSSFDAPMPFYPPWLCRLLIHVLVGWFIVPMTVSLAGAAPESVEFNRDIRPLLSDACFHCHGPDQARRQGELRLDLEAGAFAQREGHRTLVPGHPEQSELYRRITATDPEERMPPADSGRSLTPAPGFLTPTAR